jgi:hypothetical protein
MGLHAAPFLENRSSSNLDNMVEKLGYRMHAKSFHDRIKSGTNMPRFVAYHRQAENDELSMVQGFNLRNRNIELVVQAIFDAANHLPLVFQSPRLAHQKPHLQSSNMHISGRRASGIEFVSFATN